MLYRIGALRQPTANSSTANSSRGHEFEREFDRASSSSPSPSSSRDGLAARSLGGQFDAGPNAELVENMGEVGLDRPWRDTDLHADLPVGATAEQQVDQFVSVRVRIGHPRIGRVTGLAAASTTWVESPQPLGRARFRVAGQSASAATLRLDGRRVGAVALRRVPAQSPVNEPRGEWRVHLDAGRRVAPPPANWRNARSLESALGRRERFSWSARLDSTGVERPSRESASVAATRQGPRIVPADGSGL